MITHIKTGILYNNNNNISYKMDVIDSNIKGMNDENVILNQLLIRNFNQHRRTAIHNIINGVSKSSFYLVYLHRIDRILFQIVPKANQSIKQCVHQTNINIS